VFISRKLNRWGNRFGFVRFCDVKNISKLEAELDSIRIGSMKLYVNLPRYRKHGGYYHTQFVPQVPRAMPKVQQGKIVKQWRVKTSNQKQEKRINSKRNSQTSKNEWKGRIISTQPLKLPWLEDNWVGILRDYMSMELLHEELLQDGLGSIRVRYLGDKQVLLSCQDGVKISDIVKISKESLGSIFETIKPWDGGMAVGNKEVWTRCRGIPLFLWTVDCFRKVLDTVGTLVDVDEATLNWECVEFARLKVRLAVASKVQICEEIWINDRVYQIYVEEEYSFVEGRKHNWFNEYAISDSSSAMESRVGDSFQSLEEGLKNVDDVHAIVNVAMEVDHGRSSSDL